MSPSDGGTYAPAPLPDPVVGPGEFTFAAIGLDHGHIYGMSEGLAGAGQRLGHAVDVPVVQADRGEDELARADDRVGQGGGGVAAAVGRAHRFSSGWGSVPGWPETLIAPARSLTDADLAKNRGARSVRVPGW